MSFDYNCGPAMLVLDGAILNTTEGIVQVLGDRTRFIAKVIALACIEVVDIADRTDYRSSSNVSSSSSGICLRSTFIPRSSANCIKLLLVIDGRIDVLLGVT